MLSVTNNGGVQSVFKTTEAIIIRVISEEIAQA
jgi:hypothetical protein